jgi:hypothetical protein
MDPEEIIALLFGSGVIITIITVLLTVLISVLCTVVPIVAIFWFLKKSADKDRAKHQASLTWHMTTGKIIKSRVEVMGGETASVSPRIVYEYDVYGRTYQSEQIRAGGIYITDPNRSAYEIVDSYPVGKDVTVYYDPNNPEDAALER